MPRNKGALKSRSLDTSKRSKAGRAEAMRREYEPRLCNVVINQGRRGKSRAQIAMYLGVSRRKLSTWEAAHADFREAMEIALDYSLAYWETKGEKHLTSKHFQANVLNKIMSSRYPKEYGDKSQIEVDVPLTTIVRRIVFPPERGAVDITPNKNGAQRIATRPDDED